MAHILSCLHNTWATKHYYRRTGFLYALIVLGIGIFYPMVVPFSLSRRVALIYTVLYGLPSIASFLIQGKIIQWDESNFDCSQNLYAKQAMEQQKWAFITDYVRLKVVYEQGGIYLDTDVELLRPLDDLLRYEAFFGFEDNADKIEKEVATGLGFGAQKNNAVVERMLRDYDDISFLREDGTQDLTPCPKRNTKALRSLGLLQDGSRQTVAGAEIFPCDYFCPMAYPSRKECLTENTYSIHHYHASWYTKSERLGNTVRRYAGVNFYRKVYVPGLKWYWKKKDDIKKVIKRK